MIYTSEPKSPHNHQNTFPRHQNVEQTTGNPIFQLPTPIKPPQGPKIGKNRKSKNRFFPAFFAVLIFKNFCTSG